MNNLRKILCLITAIAVFAFTQNPAYAQIHVDASNDVGIGTSWTSSSKLKIFNNTNYYTLRLENTYNTTGAKTGFYSYTNSNGTGVKYGIRNVTYQNSSSNKVSYGIYNQLRPNGSGIGRGIYNYLYCTSSATGQKYGIYSTIAGSGSGTRYGIYSTIGGGTGYAGYFVGNVYVSGTVTSTSDARTKEDVENVENALALVNQLSGKTYRFKDNPEMGLSAGKQYGFIAQELEQVIPELVEDISAPGIPIEKELTDEQLANGETPEDKTTPDTTFKAVNYTGMIPILVEAIKEQQVLIEQQQTEIEALKATIRK